MFFGHIPIAGSLYLSSLQLSQSMEKSAEKISDGVKQGLEGHMSAEGAGKQHLADGLEHLSQAMVRRSASTALDSSEVTTPGAVVAALCTAFSSNETLCACMDARGTGSIIMPRGRAVRGGRGR